MAVSALQPPENLNASHNRFLAREGLSFELSGVIYTPRLIIFDDDHLNYLHVKQTA